ncbi:hypothetical protein E2320_003768 [Naja naja]|nr:hypothetical protein E2320_003768 [Naja naja]
MKCFMFPPFMKSPMPLSPLAVAGPHSPVPFPDREESLVLSAAPLTPRKWDILIWHRKPGKAVIPKELKPHAYPLQQIPQGLHKCPQTAIQTQGAEAMHALHRVRPSVER